MTREQVLLFAGCWFNVIAAALGCSPLLPVVHRYGDNLRHGQCTDGKVINNWKGVCTTPGAARWVAAASRHRPFLPSLSFTGM